MPPALPSEVIDNVLDFLQDDISSLCAASLVCHSFLPCARYHVFSSLSLNINNVHSLVHLLSSPTCTIPTACNVMEISVGPPMNAAWTPDIIERLQQHFTTVRQSLSVYEVVDEAIMKAILGGNGFRGPRILALFDCLLRGSGEFEVLISNRCKGVEKLVLSDVIWIPVGHLEEPETWAPEKMENTSTLKSLEMRSVSITPILHQISFHPFIHSLESFSAVFLTERHLASVQTFLYCSAATLKSCEIGYNLDYSASLAPLNLNKNTALESLTIASLNLSSFDLPHMSPAIPSHTVPMVTSVQSTVLKNVYFHIQLEFLSWFDVVSWDEIDAFLATVQTLRSVEFVFMARSNVPGEIVRVVQNRMAECHERGVLRIRLKE